MTIRRISVSQQIRERLLDRIARGQLQPGDRAIEAQVASEMSVSSIPVREAIRELVAMGVLQSAPHRGAWVRQVSLLETIQAFQVRSVLEPLAVESAAPRLQRKCQRLRHVAKQITEAAKKHEPIVAALDRGDATRAAALLRSHSTGLVKYLKAQMASETGGATSG